MVALTITKANVVLDATTKRFVDKDQAAGEALDAGDFVYWDTTTGKWKKGQCDGTAAEAGSAGGGMALATADADGARISVARRGAIVTVGTGAAGIVYTPGTTLGDYIPTADLASTNKATLAALGIGSSKVLILEEYDSGAVLA